MYRFVESDVSPKEIDSRSTSRILHTCRVVVSYLGTPTPASKRRRVRKSLHQDNISSFSFSYRQRKVFLFPFLDGTHSGLETT